MDFLIAIFGGLAMATVMCLLYNKYGAKGVISLVTILIIICGVLVHQAGGNMTVFFLLLVPMVTIRLSRSLLLMNLLFIGLFFGSCSTSKLIEPTEPTETVTTFNYSQVFKAKLVAQGIGEVPLYTECSSNYRWIDSVYYRCLSLSKRRSVLSVYYHWLSYTKSGW